MKSYFKPIVLLVMLILISCESRTGCHTDGNTTNTALSDDQKEQSDQATETSDHNDTSIEKNNSTLFEHNTTIENAIFSKDDGASSSDLNSSNTLSPRGFGAIATPKELLDTIEFATAPSTSLTLPLFTDLSLFMPPVGDQGVQNSCVGWAVGYYLKSYQEHIEHNSTYGVGADYSHRYSPAFIYNLTKTDSCEEGSNIFDALRLLQTTGDSLWEDMPYTQNDCDRAPSHQAMIKAKCGKIEEFKRFDVYSRDLIVTMRYFLTQNYPIVAAIIPYEEFVHPKLYNGEYFYTDFNPGELAPIFSHAIVVTGYDDTREAFKVLNSWGTQWGNDGYLWIDYEVFQKIVLEAFIAQDKVEECTFSELELEQLSQDIASGIQSDEIELVGGAKKETPIILNISDNTLGAVGVKLINREWIPNTVTFTFTFSSSVIDFDIDDITVANANKSNFKGSGNTYYLDVTPPVHSTTPIQITINQGSAVDREGNSNVAATTTQEVNTIKAFITTWDTTQSGASKSYQIRLGAPAFPEYGYYNYTIDWGDGEVSERLTRDSAPLHSYIQEGNYTISITGDYPVIALFDSYYIDVDNLKLISIDQWGTQPWQSMESAFAECENMVLNAIDNPNLKDVTNMYKMFYNAKKFDGNISNWDVTKVTNMKSMFEGATLFKSDLNDWDVSKVTNMSAMFKNARSFNGNISNWDLSNVTDMSEMFYYARVFNRDLSSWDVSNVKSMHAMFEGARDFNTSLANWDLSNLTDMGSMFKNASNFTNDLSSWNVTNVEDMSQLFFYAKNFNSDLSRWDVSSVKDMSNMFNGALQFTSDLSSWNVSSVRSMEALFSQASSFTSDLSGWDVSNVTDMDYMFNGAVQFRSDLSNWDVSNVESMRYLFAGLTNFTSDLSRWNVSKVEVMHAMFQNAKSFDGDLSSWDISEVTNMSDMFVGSRLSTQNYDKMLASWSKLDLNDHVTWGVGNTQYSPDVLYNRQYLVDTLEWTIYDGGMLDQLTQTTNTPNESPTILSFQDVLPSQGYIGDTFTFEATLSHPLPSSEYGIYLNFDDLTGGWIESNDTMGHLKMNCSGTRCGLFAAIDREGNQSVRAGVFQNDLLIGEYSNALNFTVLKKLNTNPPTGGITGFFDDIKLGTVIYTNFHGYAYGEDNISTLTLTIIQSDNNKSIVNEIWRVDNDYNYHGEYSMDTTSWQLGEYQYFFILQDSSGNTTTYSGSFDIYEGDNLSLYTSLERVKGTSLLTQGQKDIALKLYGTNLDQVLKISIPGIGEVDYQDTENFYREPYYLSFYIPQSPTSTGLPVGDVPITLYTNNGTIIYTGFIYVEESIDTINTPLENNETNTTSTQEINTTTNDDNSTTSIDDTNSTENNGTNATPPENNTTLCDTNLSIKDDINLTTSTLGLEVSISGLRDLYMGEYFQIQIYMSSNNITKDIVYTLTNEDGSITKILGTYQNVQNATGSFVDDSLYIRASKYDYPVGNYTFSLKITNSNDPSQYDTIEQQFKIVNECINPIPKLGNLEFFNCGVKAVEYNATDNIAVASATLNLLDKTTYEMKEIYKWNYIYRTSWSYDGPSVGCDNLVLGKEYDLILTIVDGSGNEANDTTTFITPELIYKPVVYIDDLRSMIMADEGESVTLRAYDGDLDSMRFTISKEGNTTLLMDRSWTYTGTGTAITQTVSIPIIDYAAGSYISTLTVTDKAGYITAVNQSFEVVPVKLDPPEYIRLSNEYTDRIEASWKAVKGATHYYLYRCVTTDETPNDNDFSLLSIIEDTNYTTTDYVNYRDFYTDRDVDIHYRYFYKVKSYNIASGLSDFSEYSKGYIILEAPTNVQAIDNIASDTIRVAWDSVEYANLYYIFRATAIDGTYSYWEHTTDLYYDDTLIDSGVTYYYKIWAEIDTSPRTTSNYSEPSNGYTQITTPTISIDTVTPSNGYELDNFTFTATLSSPLPSSYELYLNFDNLEGGWLTTTDENGYIKMSCSDKSCTLTMPIQYAGTRQIRAVLFKDGKIQSATYSSTQNFTVNSLTYYQLQNANSSKCLDSYLGGTTNGTHIIQYNCTNADSLQWSFKDMGNSNYFIVNNKSKKCIKVPNNSTNDSTVMELGECLESDSSTLWQQDGKLLRNSMNDKCLDVYSALSDDFTNIIQTTCNVGAKSMQWSIY